MHISPVYYNKEEKTMKKFTAIVLSVMIVLLLAACGSKPENKQEPQSGQTVPVADWENVGIQTPDIPIEAENTLLTREEAVNKALSAAGLTKEEVRELEAELDRERGGLYWKVEFKHGTLEYDYDIHAETGEVTRVEQERD